MITYYNDSAITGEIVQFWEAHGWQECHCTVYSLFLSFYFCMAVGKSCNSLGRELLNTMAYKSLSSTAILRSNVLSMKITILKTWSGFLPGNSAYLLPLW